MASCLTQRRKRAITLSFLRPSAEVIDYVGDPQHSVDDLMATVFHRVGLLLPWSRFAGYGLDRGTTAAFDVLDFGRGADAPAPSSGVVVFPAPCPRIQRRPRRRAGRAGWSDRATGRPGDTETGRSGDREPKLR